MYQRKPDADSVWQFFLRAEGEGRIRRSTKTGIYEKRRRSGIAPWRLSAATPSLFKARTWFIKTIDPDAPENESD
ncbi:hypothetical protein SynMVIR181_00676 [Synechococcus sp. MVIR-18-1]|nr:hypothetical protein SynMVIR181_00676 [Synechococcus sp. MVIR-18-1]